MSIVFDWDSQKNELLINTRGVSFEEVVVILENDEALDIIEHPNQERYPHQQMYVVEIRDYVYLVPFVKDDKKVFLKTIFPNRKAQKYYLGN